MRPPQHLPLAAEPLAYDDDGNLLSDACWTLTLPQALRLRAAPSLVGCLSQSAVGFRLTWDSADRLVKMVSLPFYQPATTLPATPLLLPVTLSETKVAGQTVEFTYDAFSRRISKKVTTQAAVAPGAPVPAPVLATWEAYVYDDWNMVATYSLQRTGSTPGKVEARVASHVWGPDIGSKLEARSTWQAAGGVGGLLMTLYPSSASGVPNLPNFVVQGPIMDHMGNVTSVLRMDSSAGLAQLRPEFLYDYDAFGKEIRSTALIAGSNPDSYPFHFSTKYTDGETGLVYYGYRFYDPVNGRWINRDPIGEAGGLNLFQMVGNYLLDKIDKLGLLDPGLVNPRSPAASLEKAVTSPSTAKETTQMLSEANLLPVAVAVAPLVVAAAVSKFATESQNWVDEETDPLEKQKRQEKRDRCLMLHQNYEAADDRVKNSIGQPPSDGDKLKYYRTMEYIKNAENKATCCDDLRKIYNDLKKSHSNRSAYNKEDCQDVRWKKGGNTTPKANHEKSVKYRDNAIKAIEALANKKGCVL